LQLRYFSSSYIVGPISLIGGTAAVYTSLLQHPSSTLTQLSFVFMMLLAIQYALQPRLSRKYISPKIDKQSVALVEEVIKTGMAAAIFFAKPAAEVHNCLKGVCILRNINLRRVYPHFLSCHRLDLVIIFGRGRTAGNAVCASGCAAVHFVPTFRRCVL
jgi:hypothetical protein